MNTKSCTFLILCFILFSFLSCKSDDDEVSENNEMPLTFAQTCCQVSHLEACIGGADIFVPNAFTPNGDGVNDIFAVYPGQGLSKIDAFKIFKADGTPVYEVFELPPDSAFSWGWDGTLPGGIIEDGIYNYEVSVTNIRADTRIFAGQVCLRSGQSINCVDLEAYCAYGNQHNGNGGFDPTIDPGEECQ